MRLFFLVLISAVFLSHCTEVCNDCELTISEPAIFMEFINQDSLSKVDEFLAANTELSDSLALVSDSLNQRLTLFSDSLLNVQIGLDTGNTELSSIEELLLSQLSVDSALVLQVSERALELDSLNLEFNSVRSVISSGLIKVSEVRNTQSDITLILNDSATLFQIPLDVNENESMYEFVIADLLFDLHISHQNQFFVDDKTNVRIRMEDLQIVDHTFDSLLIQCNSQCNSNETTITCYF